MVPMMHDIKLVSDGYCVLQDELSKIISEEEADRK